LGAEPEDSTPDIAPAKRPRARPLDTGGEQADEIEDKPKGTSTYILYLDGINSQDGILGTSQTYRREKRTYISFSELWMWESGTTL
jgi:hypothetical protein